MVPAEHWKSGMEVTCSEVRVMSLRPEIPHGVPEQTARVARAAFPHGSMAMRIRDQLGPVFTDAAFAGLFSKRGQPAVPPGLLALVSVLQYVENLSDRQAAHAVRGRIDWKYLLGLELTDPGFDYSVLCEFRARLLERGVEQQVLDAVLGACAEAGLLAGGGTARTDATHVVAAVRVLNRLELVGETMRAALNALAAAAPQWLGGWMPPEWVDRYGHRVENYRLPQSGPERAAYAAQVGADGAALLAAVDAEQAPGWVGQVEAVAVLRRVWHQQYDLTEGHPRWRDTADLPPSAELVASPYDPQARFAVKRSTGWVGYKAHLTEVCDPDRPHLLTQVETTSATDDDSVALPRVHAGLAQRELLPHEHLVDTRYISAAGILAAERDHGVRMVGPVSADTSWQGRAGEGFDVCAFDIDWQAQHATCPQGKVSTGWRPRLDHHGTPVVRIRFRDSDCGPCPVRARCTQRGSGARALDVRPQQEHEVLQQARREQATPEWKQQYDRRAGIEGSISDGVCDHGLRRTRYRGLTKTHLKHLLTAAAINLTRADAWLCGVPLAKTRMSRLSAICPAAA
jgi:transposase